MVDQVVHVTQRGYFSRIGESIKGFLFGLILFVGSFVLLFWNEGRALSRAQSLEEGESMTVSVPADPVDPANESKLVHVTGDATTAEALSDDVFHVSAVALRFARTVEMYQWTEEEKSETRKKLGGGEEKVTTYSYDKKWSDDLISSSSFKEPSHQNPSQMPYESLEKTTQSAHLGAFAFGPELIRLMGKFEPLPVTGGIVSGMPEDIRAKSVVHDAMLYLGKAPNDPQVGDVRVSLKLIRPQTVSVVGQQRENRIIPYHAKAGGEVLIVRAGSHDLHALFRQELDANSTLTWILRVVGFAVMAVGIFLVLRPIATIADFIPAIGSFFTFGAFVFSFALALPLSLVTIGISWVYFRPLVGIPLLVGAGLTLILAIIWMVRSARKGKKRFAS